MHLISLTFCQLFKEIKYEQHLQKFLENSRVMHY